MRIRLIAVGDARGPIGDAIADYESRIGHYFRFEPVLVEAGTKRGKDDPDRVMAAEAERILARLEPTDVVVAVTRDGKAWSSRELAERIEQWGVEGRSGIAFVIGGAWGFDPAVLQRADRRLSLGAMTLPHEMARLVLVEQLYRAGSISRNEPYHKGP